MSFSELERYFEKNVLLQSQAAFRPQRAKAMNYFLKHGLPHKKMESWKYTSFKSLNENDLIPHRTQEKKLDFSVLKKYRKKNWDQVFITDSGIFLNHSLLKESNKNSLVRSSSKEISLKFQELRKNIKNLRKDSLEALSTAFSEQIVITLPANQVRSKPLEVVHLVNSKTAHYFNLKILVSENSNCQLVETVVDSGKTRFVNTTTEVLVEKGAKVTFVRSQQGAESANSFSSTKFFLKSDSELHSVLFSLGSNEAKSSIVRNHLDVHFLEARGKAQVHGITMGQNSQHFDNSTLIDHSIGECHSDQLYKSLLSDSSKAIFRGQVEIHQFAQKAFSSQLNRNLLLSENSEAISVPQLNIYADDVKATHGSTVGQLQDEEIFYFLSRGISRSKAVEMLSMGFAQDIIERIENPEIRFYLQASLARRFQDTK